MTAVCIFATALFIVLLTAWMAVDSYKLHKARKETESLLIEVRAITASNPIDERIRSYIRRLHEIAEEFHQADIRHEDQCVLRWSANILAVKANELIKMKGKK